VSQDDVADFIRLVYLALSHIGEDVASKSAPQQPAVAIKKSVSADYIVCLEDGKKFKVLKRHLRTSYNLTPDQYRKKWNLPASYPMVAPSYASHRSTLATSIGLGQRLGKNGNSSSPAVQQVTEGVKGKKRAPTDKVDEQADGQSEE